MRDLLFERRAVLVKTSMAVGALLLGRRAGGQAPVTLRVDTAAAGFPISPDFVGLS